VGQDFPGSQVLNPNFEISCSEINLFVGNQGCGKSTILQLLQKNHKDIEITLSDYVKKNGATTFYFDSERDNPRIKDPELFTKPNGENIGIGFAGAMMSRFQSHGEILEKYIINPLLKAKDCIIFLDEPESGLSITNQFKLIKTIKKAAKNNCQIFMATHCYPLILEFNVISLEHSELMTGKEFINKVK